MSFFPRPPILPSSGREFAGEKREAKTNEWNSKGSRPLHETSQRKEEDCNHKKRKARQPREPSSYWAGLQTLGFV